MNSTGQINMLPISDLPGRVLLLQTLKYEAWVLPLSSLQRTTITSVNLPACLWSGDVVIWGDTSPSCWEAQMSFMKTLYKCALLFCCSEVTWHLYLSLMLFSSMLTLSSFKVTLSGSHTEIVPFHESTFLTVCDATNNWVHTHIDLKQLLIYLNGFVA
jgi:hypothetical protein